MPPPPRGTGRVMLSAARIMAKRERMDCGEPITSADGTRYAVYAGKGGIVFRETNGA